MAKKPTRTVQAPSPTPGSESRPVNVVQSVVLGADEDVNWTWTTTRDGAKYVSGYTVIERLKKDLPHNEPSTGSLA